MKTSIIIITYNGTGRIARLLRSIELLELRDWEVLIVDDGSVDNPEDAIRRLNLNFPWRVIHQENKGRAVAKNRGAAEAVNELLWFIDDDMRVMPAALTVHLNHHRTYPRSISVGSQLEDKPLMKTDIQQYKCFISDRWKLQIEAAPNPLDVNHLYMTSANVSIGRELFKELKGFDERLRDAEDLDLAYRAYLTGIPIFYNKEATGYHLDLISCLSYIRRNRQYTIGYSILRKLKPHYMEINRRMHFNSPTGSKKLLLSLISQPVFVRAIDHFNVFLLLPRRLRYRFYELLIFGLGRLFPERKL